jgi:DNA-binding response OmpR family regulator
MQYQGKILFVDDNSNQLILMRKYFEKKLNYQIDTCNKPESFPAQDFNNYDIIITDMMMPQMDGLDLLKTIKVINPNIPVIMLTAHSSVSLVVQFMKDGGTDYVEKPIDFELLNLKINRALEDSKLKENLKKAEIKNLLNFENNKLKQEIILSILNGIFNPLNSVISFSKKGIEKFSLLNDETKLNYYSIILNGGQCILDKLRSMAASFDQEKPKLLSRQDYFLKSSLEKIQNDLSCFMPNNFEITPFEDFSAYTNIENIDFAIKFLLIHANLFAIPNTPLSITAYKNGYSCIKISYTGILNFNYTSITYTEFSAQEPNSNLFELNNILNICNRVLHETKSKITLEQVENKESCILITL